MFIKLPQKSKRGWTMVELLVSTGVFAISGLALATIFVFTIRSFAAMANYSDLDKENRSAMDKMTREIREAKKITAYTTNSITLLDGNNNTVSYTFKASTQQLIRTGNTGSQVLLNSCNLLSFSLFERPPVGYSFDRYPIANANWQQNVKGVQLTWKTSRVVSGTPVINSENVQTAVIVIRKQQQS
jgi:Tfp pilus assembly protein PilW